jgi:hypothetical protein
MRVRVCAFGYRSAAYGMCVRAGMAMAGWGRGCIYDDGDD